MPYRVTISSAARRAIRLLDRPIQLRIVRAAEALGLEPRPSGCRKLEGADLWRVRVGDWRIVYRIEDDRLLVLVIRVGHRGDVYRAK